jgi:hypothetical protein
MPEPFLFWNMNGKKIVLLFVGLALPILVFVFLKVFGRNEFNVPLIYENGVKKIPEGCDFYYGTPYLLNDSLPQALGYPSDKLVVINFDKPSKKLKDLIGDFAPDVVLIANPKNQNGEDSTLVKCALLLHAPETIVLIDQQKQIRGYYTTERDELDRLEAELKIILKKY